MMENDHRCECVLQEEERDFTGCRGCKEVKLAFSDLVLL